MRYLNLAAVIASASVAAACGLAPSMTTYTYPKYGFTADFPAPPKVDDASNPQNSAHITAIRGNPVKAVEDPLMMSRVNANSGILDLYESRAILGAGFNGNLTARGSVFDGVIQQVHQNLLQPFPVTRNENRATCWPV